MELTIEKLSHDGRGIAHNESKVIFVNQALPQEKVIAKIYKKHSQFDEADLVEIIEPSPDRVMPECAHFGICGGCSLQHFSSSGQILAKQEILLHNLNSIGHVQPEEVYQPITAHPWHYRRKARLGVKYVHKKQRVLVGFREKKGRYLADLQSCLVLEKAIGEKLTVIASYLEKLEIKHEIPQLEVAIDNQGVIMVIRHLQPFSEQDLIVIKSLAQDLNFRIYLQPKGLNTVAPFYPENIQPQYSFEDIVYNFEPIDFIQVNKAINEQMVKRAINLLEINADDIILDLFCGLGNFTLPIAKHAQYVIGVEGELSLVTRAEANAQCNQIENVEFYQGNLFEPPLKIKTHNYNKVLLDPPRSGAKEIIPEIMKNQPQRIVYVSCDTATLARDAGTLVNQYNYQFKGAGVLDMFPHTSHVESIALFIKN